MWNRTPRGIVDYIDLYSIISLWQIRFMEVLDEFLGCICIHGDCSLILFFYNFLKSCYFKTYIQFIFLKENLYTILNIYMSYILTILS